MSRLAWALATAFVLHLALLQIIVPVREKTELNLQGADHVRVRLTQLREQPADAEAVEPEPEPVPVVEPDEEKVTIPETQPEPASEPMLAPVKTKTRIRDAAVSERSMDVPPVRLESVADTEQKVKPAAPAPTAVKSVPAENGGPDGGMVRQAEPLTTLNRPPVYPKLARKRGWEGTVLLEVDVDRDGMVASVRVRTSSSYTLLDREALAAVKKWRFKPGTIGGRPTDTKVMVPVHFMLQEN